jgi:hypothetical protein
MRKVARTQPHSTCQHCGTVLWTAKAVKFHHCLRKRALRIDTPKTA